MRSSGGAASAYSACSGGSLDNVCVPIMLEHIRAGIPYYAEVTIAFGFLTPDSDIRRDLERRGWARRNPRARFIKRIDQPFVGHGGEPRRRGQYQGTAEQTRGQVASPGPPRSNVSKCLCSLTAQKPGSNLAKPTGSARARVRSRAWIRAREEPMASWRMVAALVGTHSPVTQRRCAQELQCVSNLGRHRVSGNQSPLTSS